MAGRVRQEADTRRDLSSSQRQTKKGADNVAIRQVSILPRREVSGGQPYGEGYTSLYLFLPDQGTALQDFFTQLNDENWNEWLSRFRRMQGNIKLPRFKLEYDRQLNEALKTLGMAVAFDRDRADFSRMRAERDLFIQQVLHKAVAEVNEEGTEASAVSSVSIGITSAPVSEPFTFVVDHPFFMALHDERTGTILFMGAIMEPQ